MDTIDDEIRLIKARMARMGVKQTAIAELLGLHASAVSNIFNGKRKLSAKEARAIETMLDLGEPNYIREIPLYEVDDLKSWLEGDERGGGFIPVGYGLYSNACIAVRIEKITGSLAPNDVTIYVADPEETSLFDGRLYLTEAADGSFPIAHFRNDPARFVAYQSEDASEWRLDKGVVRPLARIVSATWFP